MRKSVALVLAGVCLSVLSSSPAQGDAPTEVRRYQYDFAGTVDEIRDGDYTFYSDYSGIYLGDSVSGRLVLDVEMEDVGGGIWVSTGEYAYVELFADVGATRYESPDPDNQTNSHGDYLDVHDEPGEEYDWNMAYMSNSPATPPDPLFRSMTAHLDSTCQTVCTWWQMVFDDPSAAGGYMTVKADDFHFTFFVLLPGDANRDGAVTDADYTIWADNYGASDATWDMGDFNDDGVVTDADYTIWADRYAQSSGQAPVPEPASLALMGMACAAFVRRR